MMTNQPLYIVTTDFDFDESEYSTCWDQTNRRLPHDIIERQKKRYGEIRTNRILEDTSFYRSAIKKHLQHHEINKESLFPCLELLSKVLILHAHSGFVFEWGIPNNVSIDTLELNIVRLINLSDPRYNERLVNRAFNGLARVDLIFNYFSNEGKYDTVITNLKNRYPVTEVEIRRENMNIRFEGWSEEEMREYWSE